MQHIQIFAYTSPYVWIFWAVFLFAFVPEFMLMARSRPAQGEKTDQGSMQLIMLVGWIAFPAAFTVASWARFVLLDGQKFWFGVGMAMLLGGSLLRRYCWRVLGKYFTGNVRVQADQRVIQEGIYKWVRHPSYTGGMLMYLGVGLGLTNWLSALILVAMGAATYAYRVRVEERALGTSLGSAYLDYMQRTTRFIPFVF